VPDLMRRLRDSLEATVHRDLMGAVAAAVPSIEDVIGSGPGQPFVGVLGDPSQIQTATGEPRPCRCCGGCEQDAEPGDDLCRGCRADGCDVREGG
jgi:hypothetical protein